MAENQNQIESTVRALFDGMDSLATTKTVVGEATVVGDNILIPLVDISFGIGAGAFSEKSGGGGMGGKITPSAILVVGKNGTRLINIKNPDSVSRIIDMIPDLVDKVTGKKEKDEVSSEDVEHIMKKEDKRM